MDTLLKAVEIIIEVLHTKHLDWWQAPKKICSCSKLNTEPCFMKSCIKYCPMHEPTNLTRTSN